MYSKRRQLDKGWIVFVTSCESLLYRKILSDEKQDQPFLTLVDRKTLKVHSNSYI